MRSGCANVCLSVGVTQRMRRARRMTSDVTTDAASLHTSSVTDRISVETTPTNDIAVGLCLHLLLSALITVYSFVVGR